MNILEVGKNKGVVKWIYAGSSSVHSGKVNENPYTFSKGIGRMIYVYCIKNILMGW